MFKIILICQKQCLVDCSNNTSLDSYKFCSLDRTQLLTAFTCVNSYLTWICQSELTYRLLCFISRTIPRHTSAKTITVPLIIPSIKVRGTPFTSLLSESTDTRSKASFSFQHQQKYNFRDVMQMEADCIKLMQMEVMTRSLCVQKINHLQL